MYNEYTEQIAESTKSSICEKIMANTTISIQIQKIDELVKISCLLLH